MASPTATSVELSSITATRPPLQHRETTQSLAEDGNRNHDEEPTTAQDLQPADGGREAWKLLAAAFVFEALMWGEDRILSHKFNLSDETRVSTIIRRISRLLFAAA